MGIHHFTDYVCNECKDYNGSGLWRNCGVCDEKMCDDCIKTAIGSVDKFQKKLQFDLLNSEYKNEVYDDEDGKETTYSVHVCSGCKYKFEEGNDCRVCSKHVENILDKCKGCYHYVCNDCSIDEKKDNKEHIKCWKCFISDSSMIQFILTKVGCKDKKELMQAYRKSQEKKKKKTKAKKPKKPVTTRSDQSNRVTVV